MKLWLCMVALCMIVLGGTLTCLAHTNTKSVFPENRELTAKIFIENGNMTGIFVFLFFEENNPKYIERIQITLEHPFLSIPVRGLLANKTYIIWAVYYDLATQREMESSIILVHTEPKKTLVINLK